MINLKIGKKLRLNVVRLGINGEGIAYFKRRLVFVGYALPGEEILVEIVENQRNFSRAKLLKIFVSANNRVEPKCSIYYECGGCQLMHLSVAGQLEFKRDLLYQALEKYKPRGWQNYELRETLGQSTLWNYRNKLQFQLRRLKNGRIIAGLYKEGTHRLVSLENCLVQDKIIQKIANRVCQLSEAQRLSIDDERHQRGLRTLMIRRSQSTGEVQMIFVTSDEKVVLDKMVTVLTNEFPEIKTIAVNINRSKTSEIYGTDTNIVWGDETITETVLDYDFDLSPRAFYQLNSVQANVLYAEVVKALNVKKSDHVIDAYCGVGTIGFAIAKKVKSVHGMDITPEAIADAKRNAQYLGFKNCHYETGRAEKIIPSWIKNGHRIDALIVDPPRTGLDQALLETIAAVQPEKIVYVSCNASTLAKDLVFLAQFYRVEYIQSIDMFPHTARTEAVVKLRRKQ